MSWNTIQLTRMNGCFAAQERDLNAAREGAEPENFTCVSAEI